MRPFHSIRHVKRRWKIAAALALGAALIIGGGLVFLAVSEFPGGMPSTYDAVDGDWRLTREAKSAVPIIAALRQYRAGHGCFPADVSALAPLLPASKISVAGHNDDGWNFQLTAKPAGYCLQRRLGWDPSLVYQCTPAGGTWVFEPGDGSPEKPIVLTP